MRASIIRMKENVAYLCPDSIPGGAGTFSPEEAAALESVNRHIAAGRSLEEIIDFLFEATGRIFPCDRIGLAFLEDGGRRAVAHIEKARYEPMLLRKGFWQDMDGSSLKTVLEKGSPRVIRDLEEYLKERPGSFATKLLVKEGVRSNMACPLLVEGRAIGFLFRSSRRRDAYTGHDVAMHLAVAERLAQAVEKAHLIERLEAANRGYMETLGFVSHELKSPLASIETDIDVLLGGYLGQMEPKQREKLLKAKSKCGYLSSLVKDYLDLARIESGSLEASLSDGVDLARVLDESISLFEPEIESKRMRVSKSLPQGGLPVSCDPDLMKIVFVNLIVNAVKYGVEGGSISVTLSEPDGLAKLSVRNDGPGFPESEKDALFKKFSRLRTPELLKRSGTGVGLYTCWRIVRLHGGRIWADSEEGKWAEFSFEIPVSRRDAPEGGG